VEDIYTMKLHENIKLDGNEFLSITRVAGGWIYMIPRLDCNAITSVFVPFHNEFMTQGAYLPDNELPF